MSILKNIFRALQLEGYHISRFLQLVYTTPFLFAREQRQELDMTLKMKLIIAWTIVFFFFFMLLAGIRSWFAIPLLLLTALLSIIALPALAALAVICLWPVDQFMRKRIISRARSKVAVRDDLLVIGITGSYGKTSLKRVLAHLLKDSYNILYTPASYNTPLGIAGVINNDLTSDHDILIVEMGAYKPGNIHELCELADPSIGIITGITAQHLERFGSVETIIDTKYELFDYVNKKENGYIISCLSSDDAHRWRTRKKENYDIHKTAALASSDWSTEYLPDFWWIRMEYNDHTIDTPLLAAHNAYYIAAAIQLASHLWIDTSPVIANAVSLPHTEHRLQPIKNAATWVLVIDDSFNGNVESVRTTIKLIQWQTVTWRKILLTPWLVELGDAAVETHTMLWTELAETYGLYLFIDNPNTRAMEKSLLTSWVSPDSIVFFPSAQLAHSSLGDYLQKWDVIVFQNDLTDNY